MPLVGTAALAELWAKAKNGFGNKLGATRDDTTATVQLKNNAGTVLASASIAAADATNGAGVMTKADKAKLDGIAAGATKVIVDSLISSQSTNPVQNKVVHSSIASVREDLDTKIDGKANATHTHAASDVSGLPTKLPNPSALTMQLAGTTSKTYDGSSAVTFDVPAMGAASSSSAGTTGLVPAPGSGKNLSFLRGDGTWVVPTDTKYTHPSYTSAAKGFWKVKVDSMGHVSETHAVELSDITALTGTGSTAQSRLGLGTAATYAATTSVTSGSTSLVTSGAVYTAIEAAKAGAVHFKGVLNAASGIGTGYKAGQYWVIGTAGTYAGQTCEVGDMLFAVKDYGSSILDSDFSVVQNNIVEMTAAEVDAICTF